MPGRVLLISANRCAAPEAVFPLGLVYLNASLRAAGYETRWFDVLIEPQSLEETLREFQPDWVGISLRNVDDVVIHIRETYYESVAEMCATIHRLSGCPVIVGGSGFSVFPEQLFARIGADYGIRGEGEGALPRLLSALESGSDLGSVPGLVYRKDGSIRTLPVAPVAASAPVTSDDRPAEIVSHYLRATSMLNVQTQRGCAHACCYCTYPLIEGRHHRSRDAEAVAEEFAQLQAAGARYVFVVDAIFNSSPGHVTRICEALIRREIRMSWCCFIRPQGLTAELARLMARAGLAHAEIGSDSLSDVVLESYRKRFSFDDVQQSTQVLRAAGIECCHFLIFGGPGETTTTMDESFENSRHLGEVVVMPSVGMRIYPGTWLGELARGEGRIPNESDLLAPAYYLASGLSEPDVAARLRDYATRSSQWLLWTEQSGYQKTVERLRGRGIVAPLWSYFATIQRLSGRASVIEAARA